MDLPPVVITCEAPAASEAAAQDAAEVAALDTAFQAAVKANDAVRMAAILHDRFVMVLGNGKIVSRDSLLQEARSGDYVYDIQDEDPGTQCVRVWGDTAVVTARLRLKGRHRGKPFDRTLWFSDTYVRTGTGWRYAFAQVSLQVSRPPDTDAEA